MDIHDVIQTAAQLVDNGTEVDDEYRRGVVELAAALCMPYGQGSTPEAIEVMKYAVCGVNRPKRES